MRKMVIAAEVSFEQVIEAFCRLAQYVDPRDYTRFDLDRIANAQAELNSKLAEFENNK